MVLYTNLGGNLISINYGSLKLSLTCAISQLLIYLSIIGRMQIYKIVFSSLIFIFMWNLNYFLCVTLLKISPDSRFFDDYSISMVYVFAGTNSFLMSLDVSSRLIFKKSHHSTKGYPKIISFLGLFFIWLSFCFTNSIIGLKASYATS